MDRHVIKEIMKEHKGRRYIFPFGVLARNVETDSNHNFLTEKEIKELKAKPGSTDPVSNNTVVFENVANTKVLLQSGTKLGKLFPQINVWLSNLGTAAWKGVSNSTNVTADGYVSDARALKAVNDKLGGISFEREGENVYAVYSNGADTVRKKLGSGLEGVKKIVYRTDDVTYGKPIIEKTVEKNGNWIIYTRYTKGSTGGDLNSLMPMTEEWYSDGQPNGECQSHNHCDYLFDLKKVFPGDYQNLISDSFIFTVTHYKMEYYFESNNNIGPAREAKRSCVYDPTTGILRVVGVTVSSQENWGGDREDCNGSSLIRILGYELLIFN